VKVQFKFKAKTDKKVQEGVIRALRAHGVGGVRQLFPKDADDELSRLYIADVADRSLGKRALSLLKRSAAVEFAEPEVTRKLIR
jgi:hypothetical protein